MIDVSMKRGLHQNKSFLRVLNEVTVHDLCRKRYTTENNVLASVRRGGDTVPETSTSHRNISASDSSRQVHIMRDICFICGEKITEVFIKAQQKLPISRRNVVHPVESLNTKDKILEVAGRCGEWGQQIIRRLACISDLVAAEGMYHQFCNQKLYTNSKKTVCGRQRGRPELPSLIEGMDRIYEYLAENREECQFSLPNLIAENFTGDYKPDIKSVEAHLKRKYGEKIMFTKIGQGHTTILSFRDVGQKILYEKWYDERQSNPADERLRVVKTAAQIILEDIRSLTFDTTEYPPSDDFLKGADNSVPETLKLFLESVVLKNKRVSRSVEK